MYKGCNELGLHAGALPETHAKNRQELYAASTDLQQAIKKRHGSSKKQSKKAASCKEDKQSAVTAQASLDSSSLADLDMGSSRPNIASQDAAASSPVEKKAGNSATNGTIESPGTQSNLG